MNEFTTSEGIKLKIRPVAQRKLAMLQAARREIKPPTYEIKSVGGEVSVFEHDETTLESTEDRQAWAKYLAEKEKERAEFMEKFVAVVLSDGVIFEMPEDDEWRKRQEWQGIAIPEGELNVKMHYLLTEVLRGESETEILLNAIMELGNQELRTRREAVENTVASFRATPPE